MISAFAGALALASTVSATTDTTPDTVQIRLVANMGVLVSQGENKVLVDALFTDVYEGRFHVPTSDDREAMITASGEFDGVDALLFTHEHGDHFNAGEAGLALAANDALVLMAPDQVSSQLSASATELPDGLSVRAVPMFHMEGMDNHAFIIELGGTSVLHLGDTNPDEADFTVLDDEDIDVVLYPIWFVQSETGQAELSGRFAGARHVAVHVPAHISGEQMAEYLGKGNSLVDPGDRIVINPGDHD
ncbi:MBL fold metallo-hydrolase [Maricaulis sp.]|uniref:MBL fold metallo-hydrolase n=1 Tax=Maricaulis sp. TaxID=1486257 RepID=UPI001B002629|nr:MBL fold metallo-hydrolase [Maricaulis sp.]MBO6796556.1 MBL fold metallo-hydrolase [Maricaulis sp.]